MLMTVDHVVVVGYVVVVVMNVSKDVGMDVVIVAAAVVALVVPIVLAVVLHVMGVPAVMDAMDVVAIVRQTVGEVATQHVHLPVLQHVKTDVHLAVLLPVMVHVIIAQQYNLQKGIIGIL